MTGWAAYIAGVVWALRRAGHRVVGGEMSIASDVEMGSGLASSAALECAVLGALLEAVEGGLDRVERARIAQPAENDYVGAPTGLMDQLASLFGEPHKAMLIDFRAVSVQQVPFDPDASDVALLLINSRMRRTVMRAVSTRRGGRHASERRPTWVSLGCATCRMAGRRRSRRSATRSMPAVPAMSSTENQRVLDFVGGTGSLTSWWPAAFLPLRTSRCAMTSRSPPGTST